MWVHTLVAPRRFERLEVPKPTDVELSPGAVLLRPITGGICGSDLPGFAGHHAPFPGDVGKYAPDCPGYPLHEVVGEVIASRHPDHRIGSVVVGWASGLNGIAEYVAADGDGLFEFDPSVDPTTAVLLQPLACVLYAVDQLENVTGANVAVVGQGSIGILFSHVFKSAGAQRVTGVDVVDRKDLGSLFGVDEIVHSTCQRWSSHLVDDDQPDIVVEAIGHQTGTLSDVVTAVKFGGQIYFF
jgi:L-iditol 2-dehydrogenase